MNFFTYGIIVLIILVLVLFLMKNNKKGNSSSDGSPFSSFDPLTGVYKQDMEIYKETVQDTKHQPPYEEKNKDGKSNEAPHER